MGWGGFTLIKEVVGIENMATLLAWKSVRVWSGFPATRD